MEIEALGARVDAFLAWATRDPRGHLPAIVVLKAGAGGDEACLWVQMMLRMYDMYARSKGLEASLVDVRPNEPDGVKSATLRVSGPSAFSLFKFEDGVHRLSRISPLGHAERHTSFASVSVFPEIEEEGEIEVPEKDVEVTYCCGSGPGGQKINKTEVVARVKHLPTGIVVRSQASRSQQQNRAIAMRILASKLRDMKRAEEERLEQEREKARPKASFGNRDRTYVLTQHPLVHDYRTGKKTANVQGVLDGDLDLLRE